MQRNGTADRICPWCGEPANVWMPGCEGHVAAWHWDQQPRPRPTYSEGHCDGYNTGYDSGFRLGLFFGLIVAACVAIVSILAAI